MAYVAPYLTGKVTAGMTTGITQQVVTQALNAAISYSASSVVNGEFDFKEFSKAIIISAVGAGIACKINSAYVVQENYQAITNAMADSFVSSVINKDFKHMLGNMVLSGAVQFASSGLANIAMPLPVDGATPGANSLVSTLQLREAAHYFIIGSSASVMYGAGNKLLNKQEFDASMILVQGLNTMLRSMAANQAHRQIRDAKLAEAKLAADKATFDVNFNPNLEEDNFLVGGLQSRRQVPMPATPQTGQRPVNVGDAAASEGTSRSQSSRQAAKLQTKAATAAQPTSQQQAQQQSNSHGARSSSAADEVLNFFFSSAYAEEVPQAPADNPNVVRNIKPKGPNLEEGVLSSLAIGSGRAFTFLGQGVKQLTLVGAEQIGLVADGTTSKYTESVNQEKRMYDSTPVRNSVSGKIGEIGTDILTTVLLPGGAGLRGAKLIAATSLNGVGLGLIQVTEDGRASSHAKNAMVFGVYGTVGGVVYGKLAEHAGKAITTLYSRGRVPAVYAQGSGASAARSQGTSYQAEQLKINLQQQTCRSLFTTEGKLTKGAIDNADVLLKVEKFDQRAPIFKELSRRGNIEDWFKYKTKKFNTPGVDVGLKQTNPLAEVHFYKNAKTGEVYYGMDFKVKIDVAGQPQMTVQEFLNSLPKKWRPTI